MAQMEHAIRVSLSVTSDDQDVVTRASETLARAALGLAMEGVDAFMFVAQDEDEQPQP